MIHSGKTMELILKRCTVRSFRPEDAQSHAHHANSWNVSRNTCRMPYPYSIEDAKDWITTAINQKPETQFAIAVDGKSVGGIGLRLNGADCSDVMGHVAEVGYWLGEEFWGRGIMTEVVEAVTDWGFHTVGLVRVYAGVFARNPASARVLEKAGYAFEGTQHAAYLKDGEFIDGLLYAKVKLPQPGLRKACQESPDPKS